MRYSIEYEVKNSVLSVDEIPIKQGNANFYIVAKDFRMKRVGMSLSGPPQTVAPCITNSDKTSGNAPRTHISIGRSARLKQELTQRIRAWQATLAPLVFIDIDFNTATERFTPEDGEPKVDLSELTMGRKDILEGFEDYGIYARAFLLSSERDHLVEPTAFYIEASKSFKERRLVHAYNMYFLFLESLLGDGKFRTSHLKSTFLENKDFVEALNLTMKEVFGQFQAKGEHNSFFPEYSSDPEGLVSEIIEMRGRLRHHSLKNKRRWDPHEQHKFADEVLFLGALCQEIMKSSTLEIWRDDLAQEFVKLASDENHQTTIAIEITILSNGIPTVTTLANITFPFRTLTPQVALQALLRASNLITEKFPGDDILSLRAFDRRTNIEVFRYTVGNGITIIPK